MKKFVLLFLFLILSTMSVFSLDKWVLCDQLELVNQDCEEFWVMLNQTPKIDLNTTFYYNVTVKEEINNSNYMTYDFFLSEVLPLILSLNTSIILPSNISFISSSPVNFEDYVKKSDLPDLFYSLSSRKVDNGFDYSVIIVFLVIVFLLVLSFFFFGKFKKKDIQNVPRFPLHLGSNYSDPNFSPSLKSSSDSGDSDRLQKVIDEMKQVKGN